MYASSPLITYLITRYRHHAVFITSLLARESFSVYLESLIDSVASLGQPCRSSRSIIQVCHLLAHNVSNTLVAVQQATDYLCVVVSRPRDESFQDRSRQDSFQDRSRQDSGDSPGCVFFMSEYISFEHDLAIFERLILQI
jgi:hypothetical protein